MGGPFNLIIFKTLSLSEKFSFFDSEIINAINSTQDSELNNFLREIILNASENCNIRKKAQKIFIECVFLKKIKVRQALGLFIDDWNSNSDVFQKLQRLKDLYLFYNEEEDDIEAIFQAHTKEDENELASEAYFNLGLINMQKGFSSSTKEEALIYLNNSVNLFSHSYEIIENRIDAQFYKITLSILINLLDGLTGNIQQSLKSVANLLFYQEAFSFNFNENPFYLGFYRILCSMIFIVKEKPDNWLEYRIPLNQLYNQYSEIHNQILKERLNQSIVSSIFVSMIEKQFIEPYFALNFHAQISKINSRLDELGTASKEYHFLNYIKVLANNQDYKKKVETESIRQSFINIFPNRSYANIDETLLKVKDDRNALDLLNAFKELQSPSIIEFIDRLVSSSIKLQGNRLYRGNFSEDDRNTFISSLLEASDYIVKDQTRWSRSSVGKSSGEIDIFIRDKKGFPFSIIEALNLDSLDTAYIALHIDKIFNYDTTGLEYNFILVYSNAKNFDKFWTKYIQFISMHSYQYQFISFDEINNYLYTDIKIGKAKHIRNGREILLYHLMVDLYN
jgi:hypothetical protein